MNALEEGAIKTLKQKKFMISEILIDDNFNDYF